MRVLTANQTVEALPYARLVPAIARAAREQVGGLLNAPERLVVPFGESNTLLCMPAIGPDIGITKLITVRTGGGVAGLPAIQGEVIVFETATGRRRLLLDGPALTARRTAAVTMLAIEALARRQPQSALLIGTGAQARAHAEALIEYLGVARFWIAARRVHQAEEFAAWFRSAHSGVDITPVRASALEPSGVGADLVVALTTSNSPVVPPDLPDSTLAIGVGAFRPHMAELPVELLRRRRIVVDHLAGARLEAGDLLRAGIDWSDVRELSQVLDGKVCADERGWVFKSVGHAAWDLAAARVALEQQFTI